MKQAIMKGLKKGTLQWLNSLKVLGLATGLVFGLGSCRDDLAPELDGVHKNNADSIPSLDKAIGKVNFIFEAEFTPQNTTRDEEGRAVSLYLEDRDTRRGNPGSGEYAGEFSPTLNYKAGDQIQGLLVLIREEADGSRKEVIRQEVFYDVLWAPDKSASGYAYNSSQPIRVGWKGDISFPADINLAKDFAAAGGLSNASWYRNVASHQSKWYAIGFIGVHPNTYNKIGWNANDKIAINYDPNVTYDGTNKRQGYNATWMTFGAQGRGYYGSISVPYISQWKQVRVLMGRDDLGDTSYTGLVDDLKFRPQGTLLYYDLGVNVSVLQNIKGIGVASNVLDFQGYYSLHGDDLHRAFATRDSEGVGVPEFVAIETGMADLALYDDDSSDPSIRTGERIYPYDLPTLSAPGSPHVMWGGSSSHRKSIAGNPSMFYFYYVPGNKKWVPGNPNGPADGWLGLTRGGWSSKNSQQPYTREQIAVWGFPRKAKPAKPATIFFASVQTPYNDRIYTNPQNPTEEVYNPGEKVSNARKSMFDLEQEARNLPSNISSTEASIASLEQEIPQLEQAPAGETADAKLRREKLLAQKRGQYKADTAQLSKYKVRVVENPKDYKKVKDDHPQSLFDQYAIDSALFYGKNLPEYLNFRRIGDQPWLTLHQSNTAFKDGKIYHARPTLTNDLMISEIFYENRFGQNYSSVEIFNSSFIPVDLNLYAIARLVPSDNGQYLAYRTASGGKSDRLADAQLLPLSAISVKKANPFAGTNFKAPAGITFTDHKKRRFPVAFGQHDDREGYVLGDQAFAEAQVQYPNTIIWKNPDGSVVYSSDPRWFLGSPSTGPHFMFLHLPDGDRAYGWGYTITQLPGQALMLGASGYVNQWLFNRGFFNRPGNESSAGFFWWKEVLKPYTRWFIENYSGTDGLNNEPTYYPSRLYGSAWGNGILRTFQAYADGKYTGRNVVYRQEDVMPQYEEGTLDYHPGDAFVLVKTMADGSLQVIDATGPVGPNHLFFAGTYADFKAEFAKYKDLDHFSVQKMQGIEYPFIPPYNTTRAPQSERYSNWSDYWRVVTDYKDYTMGYYEDPTVNLTSSGVGAIPVPMFPPYYRSIWKDYNWQKYKALKPQLN